MAKKKNMSIVSSIIVEDRAQKDGRRAIRERHTDQLGVIQYVTYLAESGANATTVMTARVASIEAGLQAGEIAANTGKALNGELVFTFIYSTVAQNRAALRDLFKVATRWELLTLGWVINSLALSDTQLKSIFGVNDAQLPALKSKLSDMAAKYTAALALVGQ